MHAQTELDLAPLRFGAPANVGDLLGDLIERLAPGQIDVGLIGGELVRRLGRAAEPDGHVLLHRRKQLPGAFDADIAAGVVDRLAGEQSAKDC